MKSAINLLKKDHRTVKRLFRKMEKTDTIETRIDIFREIYDELTHHTMIEEEILYPALQSIGTREAAEQHAEAHEEHEEVKSLLHELTGLDPATDDFVMDMTRVIQIVEHHIEEEEQIIFPMMEQVIDKANLKLMGREIEERKKTWAHA